MLQQRTFNVHLTDQMRWDNFCVQGANQSLVAALQAVLASEKAETVLVWGGAGAGKSHILQACCHQLGAQAFYLPLRNHAELDPRICDGLESFAWVCVDDLEVIAGQADWEQALFHLYNRQRGAGGGMLLTAGCSPPNLPIQLADLRSRVNSGLVYQVHKLDDEGLAIALKQRANYQGLNLSDQVVQYVLRHYARDAHQLFEKLDCLEQATLVAQRPVTVPFVKSILSE